VEIEDRGSQNQAGFHGGRHVKLLRLSKLFDRLSVLWHEWWVFEAICFVISAAAMLAVFAILLRYHGRRMSEWTGVLTINAVVSILAVVSKAALLLVTTRALGQLKWIQYAAHSRKMSLFDGASRGPLGAVKLIYQ
jgi:hypothetical protein